MFEKDLCDIIKDKKENSVYLPKVLLPENVTVTNSLQEAVDESAMIVHVVPSQFTREVLRRLVPNISGDPIIVCCTKGIETETLLPMSGVFKETLPERLHSKLSFLSGPSFAKEVVKRLPTAVSVASYEKEIGLTVQSVFNTSYFRVYTNSDVIGVELGGALKNVIAIAAGVSDGLGLGHSSRAALITRGLTEITRLGVAMGANASTFAGLSGLGDLVLTATGELSRNRTVGYKLGLGMKLSDILSDMKMVAEGVNTTAAAYQLSKRYGVEMPITEQVYNLLYKESKPMDVVSILMGRELKAE